MEFCPGLIGCGFGPAFYLMISSLMVRQLMTRQLLAGYGMTVPIRVVGESGILFLPPFLLLQVTTVTFELISHCIENIL